MEELKRPQKQESYLLEDLEISTRLYQFLKNSLKIKSLDELTQKTETEVSLLCGIEHRSYLKELKNILNDKNLSFKKEEVWKGTEFWSKELENAGVKDKLSFFNDVITEKRPPHPESGYHLVLGDIILDGKKCDIYHIDQDENGQKIKDHTWSRIFIYIKE
jgi:hypothetical protein